MTAHKFKNCSRCKHDKPPEGGIELSPTKWYCGPCWVSPNKKAMAVKPFAHGRKN